MAKPIKQKTQRVILRLRKKDNLSYAEISRQTGIHPRSVAAICHRGHVGAGRTKKKPPAERVSLGVGRCPICGQMVDLPCRAAEIDSEAARRTLTASDEKYESEPILYNLSPECELRRLEAMGKHMVDRLHEPPPEDGDVM